MAFKRKRVFAPNRPFKKRTFRKRRFIRKKTWSTTSKSGSAPSYGFRSKKISNRSWSNMLWRSTLQKSHYRSILGAATVLTTNANAAVSNLSVTDAMLIGGNAFWTTLGGANPLDLGTVVPPFNGDIIVRGGTLGLTIANDLADATSQKFEIFLIKSGDDYDLTGFPTNVIIGWDPTIFPEFKSSIGRVVMRKEVLLENVNTVDVRYRLKIHKIDQIDYANGKNTYHWLVLANSPSGTSSSFTLTNYFNMSFAADAV